MSSGDERTLILEEELLILRHSGEIPEIAYHSSLHYLCKDAEGPGLELSDREIAQLQDAALMRSREIVLRDLDPDNRDLSLYRGVRRSICNWQRHLDFCRRIGRDDSRFLPRVRQALIGFLRREADDVCQGLRPSSINCSDEALADFIAELGIQDHELPRNWRSLCP
ncbi:MAG TPA: hypothetical protein ENI89_09420 [Desulfobulbus sp.]|nr:hypothetical protein [Desulfobulbus sp.]